MIPLIARILLGCVCEFRKAPAARKKVAKSKQILVIGANFPEVFENRPFFPWMIRVNKIDTSPGLSAEEFSFMAFSLPSDLTLR